MAKPRTGSGFTNLQNILKANQGSNLGQNIGGRISGVVSNVKKGAAEQESEFEKNLKENELGNEADIAQRQSILGKIPDVKTYEDENKIEEPDVKAFERFRSGEYKGPTELKDIGALRSQAEQASNLGEFTRTQPGRFTLLQRFLSRPDNLYTSGEQKLDSLLLGMGGTGALKQARREAVGAKDIPIVASQNAAARGSEAQEKAKRFADETRGLLGITNQGQLAETGGLADIYKGVQNRLGQYTQEYGDIYNRAKEQLGQGYIDRDLVNRINFGGVPVDPSNPNQIRTMGLDPISFLQRSQDPTLASVTSPEEIAKMDALSKLAGIENTYLSDREQAGKYDPEKALGFDTGRFTGQTQQKLQDYETKLDQPTNYGSIAVPAPTLRAGLARVAELKNLFKNSGLMDQNGNWLPQYANDPWWQGNYGGIMKYIEDKDKELKESMGFNKNINIRDQQS